jgi:hypothetical protein
VTHEEACRQLTDAAYALYGNRISRGEWWDEVDRIITAVEERATSTPLEPSGARRAPLTPIHSYIAPGSPLHAAYRPLAPGRARAVAQAGS